MSTESRVREMLKAEGLEHLLIEQDVLARMEIDALKNRVRALERALLDQEATTRRLLRLVGALR